MIRSIIATIMLALIAVPVAAGEDDLAAQLRALQKERMETLTDLVTIYALQYEAGYVSGEVFADAQIALGNAQLDAALTNVQLDPAHGYPAPVIRAVEDVTRRQADATDTAVQKRPAFFGGTATDLLLWHLPRQHVAIRLARAEKNNEAGIKDAQKTLVEELSRLVENYTKRYKTGTAPLEALLKARAALLDAELDAAVSQEDRAAILRQSDRNDAELMKVAERKQKAAALVSRALFLDAKIRALRDPGAKDRAAQTKAAQKERVEALTELVKIDTGLWTTGWTGLATLTQAKADLANAQADAADTSAAKVLVLTQAAKEQAEVVRITEVRLGLMDSKADVDRERLHLLDYKIRLLRERGLQKARGQ